MYFTVLKRLFRSKRPYMVIVMRHRKPIYYISRILIAIFFLYFIRKSYISVFDDYVESSHKPFLKSVKATKVVQHLTTEKTFYKEELRDVQKNFFQSLENNPRPNFISNKKPSTKLTELQLFDKLNKQNGGVSESPIDFKNAEICINDSHCFSFNKYLTWRSQTIYHLTNRHLNSSRVQPTLFPYPEDMLRPDPLIMVKDTTMHVDHDLIKRNLLVEKKRRIALGDDDLLEIPAVRRAMVLKNQYVIPNIVHFISFGCRVYRLHHYVSMLSAYRYQQPDVILLHTNCIPNGDYWDHFKKVAGNTLRIVKRSPPLDIFGNTFKKVEHQSDVARIQILLEVGGIYMDDDVYVLKSLDDLRTNEMVLGEENYDALANSVIMASKNAWFLHRWYQEYQYFDNSRWSDSSCFVPWAMWRLFPSTITIVKEKMLRPNWEEIHYTYQLLWNWRKSYTIHLYSRYMKQVDGFEERRLEEIAVLNTTYGEISRHIIWGNYHIREGLELLLGGKLS